MDFYANVLLLHVCDDTIFKTMYNQHKRCDEQKIGKSIPATLGSLPES